MQRHLESQEVSYQPWKRSRWCGTENPKEILKEGVSHEQDLKLFWVSWIVFIEGWIFQATQEFDSQVCSTSTSWQLFFAWWRSWYGSEDLKALLQELWIDLISQAPKACATSTSWQGRPSTTNIKNNKIRALSSPYNLIIGRHIGCRIILIRSC